jgi:hypothetical protein
MRDAEQIPAVPKGSGPSGSALWASVVTDYEFDEHELLLLKEACRCADRLDRLHEEAAVSGVTTTIMRGDVIASPPMVEARQQAIVLSRLLASLRLPSGEQGGELQRPQRRGASRGSYQPRGLKAVPGA